MHLTAKADNPCLQRECSPCPQREEDAVKANTCLRKGGTWCCEEPMLDFFYAMQVEPRSEGKSETIPTIS